MIHSRLHYYSSWADNVLILLPVWPRLQMHQLAYFISMYGLAQVFVPNEDALTGPADVATLIAEVRQHAPQSPLLLGARGPTGELDIRFLEGRYGHNETIPPLSFLILNDGVRLGYRYYAAQSDTVLILLHGAGGDSRIGALLAQFLSRSCNLAQVYTPDLRGHGLSGDRHGDLDYLGQLEDDLAAFVSSIRKRTPRAHIVLAGHSLGGGLAIRFMAGPHADQVDAGLLLSPFLGLRTPFANRDGWVQPLRARCAALIMGNLLGIDRWNELPVVTLNPPSAVCSGGETLSYSYRLFFSFCPSERHRRYLHTCPKSLMAFIGGRDELYNLLRYIPMLTHSVPSVQVIPQASHTGILYCGEALDQIAQWLSREIG
jgi:pimeloyl-ACP methyl ester carboxylesterase